MADHLLLPRRGRSCFRSGACARWWSTSGLAGMRLPMMARWLASALMMTLVLGGCERKPARPPLTPEPPRPKVAADGYLRSLLGDAVLSNALFSYKVYCLVQPNGIRVCRRPSSAPAHAAHEVL